MGESVHARRYLNQDYAFALRRLARDRRNCRWPSLGLLLGRYWLDAKNITNRRASLRRGKKMERFNKKTQELFEFIMLDDPLRHLLEIEDMKDFFELNEAGSGFP